MLSRACTSSRRIRLRRRHHPSLPSVVARIQPRWKSAGGSLLPPMKPETTLSSNDHSSLLPPIQDTFDSKPKRPRRKRQMDEKLPKAASSSDKVQTHETPNYLVNQWYGKIRYGRRPKIKEEKLLEATYDPLTDESKGSVQKWKTCTIRCPITGITMEAGTLRDFGNSKIKVVEGKQYYALQKWARQAAAARLWDSLRFTETKEMEPRLCEEEPILLPKELFVFEPKKGLRSTSPSNVLHNMYQQLGVTKGVFMQNFKVTETLDGYTATLTCPVTGHVVESGTMIPESFIDDFEYKAVDGKIYYESEKPAEHAAAGRFIDDVKFSQTGQTEPRYCKEEPSNIDGLEEKWVKQEAGPTTPAGEGRPASENMLVVASDQSKRPPKSMLSTIYDELQSSGFNKNMVKMGMTATKSHAGWTATFQCPVTGHTAESGRWREASGFQETDGTIYYQDCNQAEHAAAARFLDDLNFLKTGEWEPRLCEEMPSAIENFEKLSKQHKNVGAIMQKINPQDPPLLSLKRSLNSLYRLYGGKHVIEEGLATEDTAHGYTSTFSCPNTGHVVKSGRLQKGGSFRVVDGVVYYNSKVMAEKSAIVRLVDDVAYSKRRKLDARFCEEEPSEIENSGLLLYQEKGPLGMINDIYRSISVRERQSALSVKSLSDKEWTATYTCPVTGHVVQGGTLKRCGDALTYDGTTYHNNEGGARVAACARFLDNLWYTQTGKMEPRWCEETPSIIKEEGIEKLFLDPGREKGYAIAVKRKEAENARQLLGPMQMLKILFRKSQIDFRESSFETKSLDASKWFASSTCPPKWTASFTCPFTKLTVESGTLTSSRDAEVINGIVFYNNERGAKLAAAGRFLDDLRFTQAGETDERWCEEVPSLLEAEGIEKLFMDAESEREYADNLLKRSEKKRSRKDKGESADSKEVVSHSLSTDIKETKELDRTVSSSGFLEEITPKWQYESDDEDDSDEELVIQDVSSFASSGTSTLDRIMDAWSETVAPHKVLPGASSNSSIHRIAQVNPAKQKEKVIADTVAWYERLSKQGNSADQYYRVFQTSPMTIKSATAALRALANTHWNHPSEDLETNQRVEAAAKQMINLMWTSGSPSIEAYNYYLQCLADGNEADSILRAMVDRTEIDGRVLPEPDIHTFNTVIQLCALSGGDAAYSKCEEIFDLIQEAKDLGFDVRPNRDTFLSVLSSLARPLGDAFDVSAFDRDKATRWIERLQQMGEESGDTSLVADTQVYNAPLRWSGGADSSRTRPYAQILPWDRQDAFRSAYPQVEDPLWNEARKLDDWLLEMEKNGPEPDVETFEAVIQAWVRTGTNEGLEKAEQVAHQALSSNVGSRFQTFHPILAARACADDEDVVKKVEEWISRLEEKEQLSTNPGLKLDERTYLAKMMATRTMQTRLLSDSTDEAIDKAFEIAESCSRDLDELVDLAKRDSSVLLDPVAFSHVLRAWGDVAIAKKTMSSDSTDNEATGSVMGVVKKYDEALQYWLSKQSEGDDDSKTSLYKMDPQLQQLLQYSQTVYLNALSLLSEDRSAFYKYFFAAEAMLRRAQELRLMLYSSLNESDHMIVSPDDISIEYNDLYTYPASGADWFFSATYLRKQMALYDEIVDGCILMRDSDCFGDSIKLAMLVVDFVEQSCSISKRASREEAVDCTNLYCKVLDVVEAVPNESDRHEVLRRVFHSVNSLSEKGEESPFTINKDVIMAVLKTDSVELNKKSPVRPRRLKKGKITGKRQRWRTASKSKS